MSKDPEGKTQKEMESAVDNLLKALKEKVKTTNINFDHTELEHFITKFSEEYQRSNDVKSLEMNVKNLVATAVLGSYSSAVKDENLTPQIKKDIEQELEEVVSEGENSANKSPALQYLIKRIITEPLKITFTTPPGYVIRDIQLKNDKTFKTLENCLDSPREDVTLGLAELSLGSNVLATRTKPKGLLQKLMGYRGEIIIKDNQTGKIETTIQIYKPTIFAKLFSKLFNLEKKPSMHVKPGNNSKSALDIASKIAASVGPAFTSAIETTSHTKDQLIESYKKIKGLDETDRAIQILKEGNTNLYDQEYQAGPEYNLTSNKKPPVGEKRYIIGGKTIQFEGKDVDMYKQPYEGSTGLKDTAKEIKRQMAQYTHSTPHSSEFSKAQELNKQRHSNTDKGGISKT